LYEIQEQYTKVTDLKVRAEARRIRWQFFWRKAQICEPMGRQIRRKRIWTALAGPKG